MECLWSKLHAPITTIKTNVEQNDTMVVWSSSANFQLKDCVKTKHHGTVVIAITLSRLYRSSLHNQ